MIAKYIMELKSKPKTEPQEKDLLKTEQQKQKIPNRSD